jgi:lipoprotein-anchoring transpeptidase ErfK/SrfK
MLRRLLVLATLLLGFVIVGTHVTSPVATGQVPPLPSNPLQPPPQEPPPDEPPPPPPPEEPRPEHPPLPSNSGEGRRIVYSVSDQRVWLVEADERVSRSYLVSGRAGTPRAGTYRIYSRSRWSSSPDGRVRMEFMLRFLKTSGDPIGFHSIPVDKRGRPIQSEDELGKPKSKGCVRQARRDAEHLWHWAPDGTVVRVTP